MWPPPPPLVLVNRLLVEIVGDVELFMEIGGLDGDSAPVWDKGGSTTPLVFRETLERAVAVEPVDTEGSPLLVTSLNARLARW